MPMIHTVTLNPAIDRILYLTKFVPEVTNRLTNTKDGIGGKGTHVSITLSHLGIPNHAHGIVHGATGERIVHLLEEHGVDTRFQQYDNQDSRTNYLLIEETGACTCLSAKGVLLTDDDITAFIQDLRKDLKPGDYLVFSGDASNCPDPYVYNHIIEAVSDIPLKIIVDASGETLKKSIAMHPYLIKPNQDELAYLCNMTVETKEDVIAAIRSLDSADIPVIAVSLGSRGSILRTLEGIFQVAPPKVNVINTIGCGDCFLSGLIYGDYHKLSTEETLQFATAISSAAAESVDSEQFDMNRAKELMAQINVQKG